MENIKNTSELRSMLLQTIQDVRLGKCEAKQASAIAHLSAKILQSAKLDLDVLKFNTVNNGAIKAGDKVLQLVNG